MMLMIMMMKFKPLELMGERLSCLLRKSVFRWSVKAPIPQVWLLGGSAYWATQLLVTIHFLSFELLLLPNYYYQLLDNNPGDHWMPHIYFFNQPPLPWPQGQWYLLGPSPAAEGGRSEGREDAEGAVEKSCHVVKTINHPQNHHNWMA